MDQEVYRILDAIQSPDLNVRQGGEASLQSAMAHPGMRF